MLYIIRLEDGTPAAKSRKHAHQLVIQSMRVDGKSSMEQAEGRMHTLINEALESYSVKRQFKKVPPSEKTVLGWILSKLLEHISKFLHVKLRLGYVACQLIFGLIVLVNSVIWIISR